MTELDELTNGRNLDQLKSELKFQLSMGESLGGTICSHIVYEINVKERHHELSNI